MTTEMAGPWTGKKDVGDWARRVTLLGRGLSRAVYPSEAFTMAGFGGPGFLSVPIYKYNAASRQLDSTGFLKARKMEGVYISHVYCRQLYDVLFSR
jgi:hypothetical protein